jgi:ligand-binding sensor domain-containing protein
MVSSVSGEQMVQRLNFRFLIFVLILILVLAGPVAADLQNAPSPSPYTIKLFIPTTGMVHSAQVMNLINSPDKSVIIATSFGLSTMRNDGVWSTRHLNMDNISEGLMNDYITAVEFDADGNLWIGYSNGIQIYNNRYYQVIRDQQILKDLSITDLQRWDNDMWVATGHAGIHRYRNGTWTWFQPMSKGGPGFYEVSSMTLDPAVNTLPDELVIATAREGLWAVQSHEDPVRFDLIADKDSSFGLLGNVRHDPYGGGVFFFNNSRVVHYSRNQGFVPFLTSTDLIITGTSINDLAAANDGKLYLATDDGIYIWQNGVTYRHLNRFEGIGTSSAAKTVNIDAENRVWFSTPGYIGYYIDQSSPDNAIQIETVTPTPSTVPVTGSQFPEAVPTLREDNVTPYRNELQTTEASSSGIGAIIDPIIRAIRSIFTGLGIH